MSHMLISGWRNPAWYEFHARIFAFGWGFPLILHPELSKSHLSYFETSQIDLDRCIPSSQIIQLHKVGGPMSQIMNTLKIQSNMNPLPYYKRSVSFCSNTLYIFVIYREHQDKLESQPPSSDPPSPAWTSVANLGSAKESEKFTCHW